MSEQAAETVRWERLTAGLGAHLWIKCPECGDDTDYIEFDTAELNGVVEVTADCPDCGHEITAYLEALVQHRTRPEPRTP